MTESTRLQVSPVLVAVTLIGAALIGGGGAALFVSVTKSARTNDERKSTQRLVTQSSRAFVMINQQVGDAKRVADLQSAGKAARLALIANRSNTAAIRRIDAETGGVAAGVLGAQAALLTAYSAAERLATPRKEDVDHISAQLRAAESGNARATAAARRAGVVIVVTPTHVTTNDQRGQRLLSGAATKLAHWQKRVATIRSGRHERLLVINAYAKTFRSHIGTYEAARTRLDDFIADVDENGATFQEAYDFLSTASGDRAIASAAVKSIHPPAEVRLQHDAVVAAIARASSAVDAASSGVADYQFDYEGEYETYKDTPGWRTFRAESKAVAAQYESAVAEWQRRLDRLRTSLRSAPFPPHPKV